MKNKNFKQSIKLKKYFKVTSLILLVIFVFSNISLAFASTINERNLINLTNNSRMENNLEPLEFNNQLYQAAQSKAINMLQNGYFEHYTPSGQSPWDFIHAAGYLYLSAGENLAMDFVTSEGIHKAWMSSPLHRKNILNPEFTQIGIATISGYFVDHQTTMVVQIFGKPINTNIQNTIWKNKIGYWLLLNIFPQFNF